MPDVPASPDVPAPQPGPANAANTAGTGDTQARQPTEQAPTQRKHAPFAIEVFTPDDDAIFKVASVIVQGQQGILLIDAQFSAKDAQKVADRIKHLGKPLRTIYISHSDPDYYFGLETLMRNFPDAHVVATRQTVERIQATKDDKRKTWAPKLGDNAPDALFVPDILAGDTLKFEGKDIKIMGLSGPTPDRSFVWIPSSRAVVGGIPVVGKEHVWLADTQTPASHRHWLQTLRLIESMNPVAVIPGHFAEGAPLDIRSVQFTADYIRAFDEESAKAKNAAALIAAMKKRYPDLPGEESLETSAKVAKGEMKWP